MLATILPITNAAYCSLKVYDWSDRNVLDVIICGMCHFHAIQSHTFSGYMDVSIAEYGSDSWQLLAFTPDQYVYAQDHQQNYTAIVVRK